MSSNENWKRVDHNDTKSTETGNRKPASGPTTHTKRATESTEILSRAPSVSSATSVAIRLRIPKAVAPDETESARKADELMTRPLEVCLSLMHPRAFRHARESQNRIARQGELPVNHRARRDLHTARPFFKPLCILSAGQARPRERSPLISFPARDLALCRSLPSGHARFMICASRSYSHALRRRVSALLELRINESCCRVCGDFA